MVWLLADPAGNLPAGPVGPLVRLLPHTDGDEDARPLRTGGALSNMAIAGAAISGPASLHAPIDDAQTMDGRWAE